MKLINNFFHIIDVEEREDALCCRTSLNAEHEVYKAHFPGNPVTPGVCLLQMAEEILENQYGRNLKLDTAVNIRFKSKITPSDSPIFDFSKVTFDEHEAKARLVVRDETTQFVSMSLKYKVIA